MDGEFYIVIMDVNHIIVDYNLLVAIIVNKKLCHLIASFIINSNNGVFNATNYIFSIALQTLNC